jgi:hypothetical protein
MKVLKKRFRCSYYSHYCWFSYSCSKIILNVNMIVLWEENTSHLMISCSKQHRYNITMYKIGTSFKQVTLEGLIVREIIIINLFSNRHILEPKVIPLSVWASFRVNTKVNNMCRFLNHTPRDVQIIPCWANMAEAIIEMVHAVTTSTQMATCKAIN